MSRIHHYLLAPLAALLATASAQAAPISVDVDARSSIGSSVALGAGTWDVNYVKGSFTAWNGWSADSGTCDPVTHQCPQSATGWFNTLEITYGGVDHLLGDGIRWSTADYALAGAQSLGSFQVTLNSAQNVQFWIPDFPYDDNRGGLSLQVSAAQAPGAVPEPRSIALSMAGLAIMAWVSRRRGTRKA